MQIGIVGGRGQMGSFFREIFERAGHSVRVSGRDATPSAEELAGSCEMVVVSVPIRHTVGVIDGLAPFLRPDQILCDLTSLKVEPVRAMLRSPAQVLGLHPMFGPSVPSLRGQTILACPARCGETTRETVLSMFRREGARVVITTPEEHDRLMAVIQGLTHFSSLCMAETLRRLDTDLARALECTSPIYRIHMGLVGRILAQDPDLYGDMLTLNPNMGAVLTTLREATDRLGTIVAQGDVEQFRRFFQENARKFDPYRETASEETDALIRLLVSR